MTEDSESLSIVIIALIAGFIILQLRRTLGRKGGYDGKDENQQRNQHTADSKKSTDNIVPIRSGIAADKENQDVEYENSADIGVTNSSPFYDVLKKVRNFDNSFTLPTFIDGAEYAYGMILNAFWNGDEKTLRTFLSKDVLSQFKEAINTMKKEGQHFENILQDIEKIELTEASINGSKAELTLKFNSHMTVAIKDGDDKVIDGDLERVVPVNDVWTFCRDVKRGDPNWILVSTSNS